MESLQWIKRKMILFQSFQFLQNIKYRDLKTENSFNVSS